MSNRNSLVILWCCVSVVTLGCKDSKSKQFLSHGQETPMSLLKKAYGAEAACDLESFLQCFPLSAGYRKAITSLFEYDIAIDGFRRKLLWIYGPDAWDRFQAIELNLDIPQISFDVPPDYFQKWKDRLQLRDEGNKVTIEDPCRVTPVAIAYKEDSYWIFDPFRDLYGRGEFKAIRMTTAHVGDPNPDIASIKELLSRNIYEQVIKPGKARRSTSVASSRRIGVIVQRFFERESEQVWEKFGARRHFVSNILLVAEFEKRSELRLVRNPCVTACGSLKSS